MYIADRKPMFVMDLPQRPEEAEDGQNWAAVIRKLKGFLEKTFNKTITDRAIEAAIKDSNQKNSMMDRIFEFAAHTPSLITWQEMYVLTFLAQSASFVDIKSRSLSAVSRPWRNGRKKA